MNKLRIGEFSKLTRLSIKALRLYAAEGVLVPVSVDSESGYRYYTADQVDLADAIRILRSLDMSLPNIREVLAAQGSGHTAESLKSHRQRLVEQAAAIERKVHYLDALIAAGELTLSYEIELAQVQPRSIATVCIQSTLSGIGLGVQSGFGRLMSGLQQANIQPAGPPVIIQRDVIDEDEAGELELGVPISDSVLEASDLAVRELEGGTMARTLHAGPYQQVGPAYQALARWIAHGGYEVAGPPREWYLNDPQSTPESALLTAIEFPLRPQT
ncbi:MAG: MerR family transcriptional regulator [Pseudomonadales bacterium]